MAIRALATRTRDFDQTPIHQLAHEPLALDGIADWDGAVIKNILQLCIAFLVHKSAP